MARTALVGLALAACSTGSGAGPDSNDAGVSLGVGGMAVAGGGGQAAGAGGSGGPASGGTGGRGTPGGGGAAAGGAAGVAGHGGTGGGVAAGDAGAGTGASGPSWGETHTGNFWLGPVDYAETQWHNACAPSTKYPAGIQQLYGAYLMGLSNELVLQGLSAGSGQLCDVCAELVANGKRAVAHIVTYGEETGPNDIDVSPELDSALGASAGRTVAWRFVSCPTTAPIQYTFDGRQWDNTWFFRVWIRNSRVPVTKVEYRKGSGGWASADWQDDGAWQAANADFSTGFSLRLTSIDGQTLEDGLPGLNTFDPDVGVASHGNF